MMVDSNIDATAGDDGWAEILDRRAQLGRDWRERLSEHKRLAKLGCYIRIKGKKFRPISIDNNNPCGRLLDESCSEIKESRDIESAIENADRSSPDKSHTPGNKKGEHKIQAFLIREALTNNLSFCHLFSNFDDKFDELLFITDEMRFGKGNVRPDVIAIGRHFGTYFPVLIELKVDRKLTRLDAQLNNAKGLLDRSVQIQNRFTNFLSAVSGADQIDYSRMLLMLIWPGPHSGQESPSVQIARDKHILMAKYSRHEDKYSFERDEPPTKMSRT